MTDDEVNGAMAAMYAAEAVGWVVVYFTGWPFAVIPVAILVVGAVLEVKRRGRKTAR